MERLVGEIADLTIQQRTVKNELDADVAAVKERYEGRLDAIGETLMAKTMTAKIWAEDNGPEFGKKKSIEFLAGVVGFRTGTPKLKTLSGWTWAKVLENIKRLGWGYVTFKESVDKEGIIANRGDWEPKDFKRIGIECVQDEAFFVEPAVSKQENRVTA